MAHGFRLSAELLTGGGVFSWPSRILWANERGGEASFFFCVFLFFVLLGKERVLWFSFPCVHYFSIFFPALVMDREGCLWLFGLLRRRESRSAGTHTPLGVRINNTGRGMDGQATSLSFTQPPPQTVGDAILFLIF